MNEQLSTPSGLSDLINAELSQLKNKKGEFFVDEIDRKIETGEIIEINFNNFSEKLREILSQEKTFRIHKAIYRAIKEIYRTSHGGRAESAQEENRIKFSIINGNEKLQNKVFDYPKNLDDNLEGMTEPSYLDKIKNKSLDEILLSVTFEKNEDILSELIELFTKTIKGDEPLISRILFNALSSFTKNPSHLMVMERSSEGKTYPAIEISESFPKEVVVKLGGASPQSFKYEHGILVNENYEIIQAEVDELSEKIDDPKNKKERPKLERERSLLFRTSKTLLDLRNKWIIFKEPPNAKLLEALYSTLSSDEEFNEHKFVNKSGTGKNQSFTVVFQGTPAILICTARDETTNKRWDETSTRFEKVSPISSNEKYSQGTHLIGKKLGLPSSLYKKFVISDYEKERKKILVLRLIKLIKSSGGQVFNAFIDELSEMFPHEIGYRWRQYQRFHTLINLHCFCFSLQRPKLLIDKMKIPMITLDDLKWANTIMQDLETLPPNKMKWFKDVFLEAWKTKGIDTTTEKKIQETLDIPVEKFTVRIKDIVDYVKSKGGKTNTRQVRQVYLEPLFENGFVEKFPDPDNKNRDVYHPTSSEVDVIKSPLDSMIPFNHSGVKSCLAKYLKGNFRIEHQNRLFSIDDKEIINVLLSVEDSIETPEFVTKN